MCMSPARNRAEVTLCRGNAWIQMLGVAAFLSRRALTGTRRNCLAASSPGVQHQSDLINYAQETHSIAAFLSEFALSGTRHMLGHIAAGPQNQLYLITPRECTALLHSCQGLPCQAPGKTAWRRWRRARRTSYTGIRPGNAQDRYVSVSELALSGTRQNCLAASSPGAQKPVLRHASSLSWSSFVRESAPPPKRSEYRPKR